MNRSQDNLFIRTTKKRRSVKQWTSDAALKGPDRPMYDGKIPQKIFGIREKKCKHKSVTQVVGWGFQKLLRGPPAPGLVPRSSYQRSVVKYQIQ
jgi:hypothetical protein